MIQRSGSGAAANFALNQDGAPPVSWALGSDGCRHPDHRLFGRLSSGAMGYRSLHQEASAAIRGVRHEYGLIGYRLTEIATYLDVHYSMVSRHWKPIELRSASLQDLTLVGQTLPIPSRRDAAFPLHESFTKYSYFLSY